MSSFYTEDELKNLGLKSYGKNVLLSRKASIYEAKNISLGHDVRIDDFCILSGSITIGNYVHVSAFAGIWAGKTGVEVDDFVALSARTLYYAESDDYSGSTMTNPLIPSNYKQLICEKILIKRHSIVGAGSIVLPGVELGEGVAIGANSLVVKTCEPWSINAGSPARFMKARKKDLLELEKEFLKSL